MNILFVCTGNTCRSPAAEVIARSAAAARGLDTVEVASAGTFAFPGQPAAGVSVAVARGRGLDLEGHRSQEVGLELVEWADLIVGMTASHAYGVAQLAPEADVRLISEFYPETDSRHGLPVADPVGGDRAVYESTYRELEDAIGAMLDRLFGGEDDEA